MATVSPAIASSPQTLSFYLKKTHLNILPSHLHGPTARSNDLFLRSKFQNRKYFPIPSTRIKASSNGFLDSAHTSKEDEILPSFEEAPVKILCWVVFWASLSLVWYAASGDAKAATVAADSIRASSFGLKIANALRGLGWPDEAVVFTLATLPILELRGAIPVGYWMKLKPTLLTILSTLGNMVPVPFIVLYLKRFTTFLAGKNQFASQLLNSLFERARQKAGPVEEFQWLGLMLFVAVPFPGTGAWTGAIVASILEMPFWSAVSTNFVGVVFAGLLVNLLVNLGIKYAIVTGLQKNLNGLNTMIT